jgi:hypothetical protein
MKATKVGSAFFIEINMARKRPFPYRNPKLPRDIAHTRLIVDETDTDNGKFYRCANCGFPCHDKRDALGDESSRDGLVYIDYYVESYGLEYGVPASAISFLGGLDGQLLTSARVGSDGSPKTVVHSYKTTGGPGCPLCKSLNWRGDYP